MTAFDVIVVGAGPAGLALARGLAGSGLAVALIERLAEAELAAPAFDGREIALTHRSVEALRGLGAWAHVAPDEVAPLRAARVLNGGSPFALDFDTAGTSDAQLGWLVPNHAIRRALYAAAQGQPGLTLICGAQVAQASAGGAPAVVLADGRRLTGRLLVAADSRFSAVRDQLGIAARINRLGRSMLVARVGHTRPHDGIATEWFDHGQTMAMLPLNGDVSGAVLTLPSAAIAQLAAMPPAALGAELTRRYQGRLGAMEVIAGPHVYPLATTWSAHFAAPGAALIGDAAVGMHPVTAQGFNLGLASACRLAELVSAAAARGGDIAAPWLLRRYEARHRLAALPVYEATNLLVSLYITEHPAARAARFAALRAAARLPLVSQGVSRLLLRR